MKPTLINRREFLRTLEGVTVCSLAGRAMNSIAAAAPPLDLGSGPQLFLDDYMIEKREGLKREVRPPLRHGPPVLDSKTFGVTQPYFTVLRDTETKKFRMFYNHGPAIWHAESDDGIAWRNPRVAYDCPRGYGCSLINDLGRDPDPARRFKMANWASTPGRDDKPGDDSGMWVYFSPNAFAWTLHDKNPVLPTWPEGFDVRVRHGIGDTVDVYYDDSAKLYRAAVKVNGFPEDGWAPAPKAGRTFRRLVGMSSSKDFIHWEKPWRILVPDDKDEGTLEFYGMGGLHLRGGLHIGLVRVLRDDLPCDPGRPKDGIGYSALVTSRDGVSWQRMREPFLDRNLEPGSWDHAMTWMSMTVPVGDEMYFYYGGYARGHKIEAKTERQIGLARMKRDRYVALTPEREQGTLTTQPFLFPGGVLTINADAAKGEVRVRILSAEGQPMSGFGEAKAVATDALAAEVHWPTPLEALKGRPVRLKFALRNAALFGFEFRLQP